VTRFEGHADPPSESEAARESKRILREYKRIRFPEPKPDPATVARRPPLPPRQGIGQEKSGKWRAWVPRAGGKCLRLGTFATEADAIEARLDWIAVNVLPEQPTAKREPVGLYREERKRSGQTRAYVRAYVMVDRKRVFIPGSFATDEEAELARARWIEAKATEGGS
jgi:hypothetical protein